MALLFVNTLYFLKIRRYMNFFSQHIVRSMQIIVNITKLFLTISIENSYIEKKDVLNNKYIIYSQI